MASSNIEAIRGLGLAATRAPAPFFLWGGQGKPKYVSTLPSAADTRNTPATSFVRHTAWALARLKPKYHQENRALAGDRGIAGQGNKARGYSAAEKHQSLPPSTLQKTRCCHDASITDPPHKAATNATMLHDFVVTHCIL